MIRGLLSACLLLSAFALDEEALSLMQMKAKISSRHQAPPPPLATQPAPAEKNATKGYININHLSDRMFKRFDQDENDAIDIHEAHHMFRRLLKEERIEKLPTATQIKMLQSLAGDDHMLQKDEFKEGLKAFLNAKVQLNMKKMEDAEQQDRSLEGEISSGEQQDLEMPSGQDLERAQDEEIQQKNEGEQPWLASHPKWEDRQEERQRLKEHPNVADRIDRREVSENQKNNDAWRASHSKFEERYEERQRLKEHPNVADRIDRRDVRETEEEKEQQAQQDRSLESEIPSGEQQDLEMPSGQDLERVEEEEIQQKNEGDEPWIASHPKWEDRDEERQRLKEHPNVADRIDRREVIENQKNNDAWTMRHPKWEERYEERQRLKEHPNVAHRIDRRDVHETEEEKAAADALWKSRHPKWEERHEERLRLKEHPNVADRIDRREVREEEKEEHPNVAARVDRRAEDKDVSENGGERSLESENQSEEQQDAESGDAQLEQQLSSVAETLFKMADTDGNSVVDPEEAQLMFTKLVAKGSLARMPTPEEVQQIVAFAGDDGLLQRDEFAQVVRLVWQTTQGISALE